MAYHFANKAWEDYLNSEKNDKKKIESIIKDLIRGNKIAHAEPLKHDLSGFWSVHINKKDRLVYKLENETLFIINCKGHYGDK